MKKYLRMNVIRLDVKKGGRYEVIEETSDRYVFIDDAGDRREWSKTRGERWGWYTVETEEESAPITVLPDESLGGVLREYREVKRKADVGERIKNLCARTDYPKGHVAEVLHTLHNGDAVTKDLVGDTRYSSESSYVVLEPTDIVRIDAPNGDEGAARFRMVDRKAAVGERVIMTAATGTRSNGHSFVPDYHNGDIFVIERLGHGDLAISTAGKLFYHREYHVLEPVTSADPTPAPLSTQPATLLSSRSDADQIAENIAALTAQIQSLESRVAALEDERKLAKLASGTVDTTPPSFILPRKSAQEIRDEIVERAKFDVRSKTVCRDVDFVINRDKRTVVALVRGVISGKIVARGTAKCAPNDVFNAHIGRAIALRRALGLDVPAEYLSAPNPESVRVGDVVLWTNRYNGESTSVFTISEITPDGYRFVNGGWDYASSVKVIDDTREGADDSASSSTKGVAS